MDEPFGALDPKTQEQLQSEFANLKRMLKKTIVFVTHDVYEAVIMGDKIAILKDGELQQYVEPLQIWHNPANDFVASFVGAEFGFHVFSRFCLKEISFDPVKDHSYDEMLLSVFNPSTNLKVVVAEMIRNRSTKAVVVLVGKPQGIVTFEGLLITLEGPATEAAASHISWLRIRLFKSRFFLLVFYLLIIYLTAWNTFYFESWLYKVFPQFKNVIYPGATPEELLIDHLKITFYSSFGALFFS